MAYDEGLRLDDKNKELIICELNAVDEMSPVRKAQILGHPRLTGKRLGSFIYFNVPHIKTTSIKLYYCLCGLVS
jgi:hypothetical protein